MKLVPSTIKRKEKKKAKENDKKGGSTEQKEPTKGRGKNR